MLRGKQPGHDWLVDAMQMDMRVAGLRQAGDSWFSHLQNIVTRVHSTTGMLATEVSLLQTASQDVVTVGSMRRARPIDIGVASRAFDAFMCGCWSQLPTNPRDAPSHQVTCCTYEQWFAGTPFAQMDREHPESWCAAFHRLADIPTTHLLSLLRFRLGAHCLAVATGRWTGLARGDRVCHWCGNVDDEFHLVFECPAFGEVRRDFADLFVTFGGHHTLVCPTTRTAVGWVYATGSL